LNYHFEAIIVDKLLNLIRGQRAPSFPFVFALSEYADGFLLLKIWQLSGFDHLHVVFW
jgi:hypothetical protein